MQGEKDRRVQSYQLDNYVKENNIDENEAYDMRQLIQQMKEQEQKKRQNIIIGFETLIDQSGQKKEEKEDKIQNIMDQNDSFIEEEKEKIHLSRSRLHKLNVLLQNILEHEDQQEIFDIYYRIYLQSNKRDLDFDNILNTFREHK